ncbi:MAG: dTDP-glucose 4,6 dehydratase [Methanobacterium sp. PtaU1.Bin242]|nr:MAG: dTDP-glucose 4,6 dehydratase [Methanobacterium sp. PtaU1.Bin242]
MNVLLTARGFLGGVLEKKLKEQGHIVEVMGRDKDVRIPANFKGINDIDLVIHNAGIVSSLKGLEDPHTTYETNIMGTVNVLEFCRKKRTPLIFISSCKIEPTSRLSWGSYGVSKVAGELIVKDYWKIYGVPYIIVRPASIYGMTQDGVSILGWITWFIKAAIHDYEINIEGDGEQRRDSIHVEDLGNLLVKMAGLFYEGANKAYEVGWGEEGTISVNELIRCLEKKSGKKLKTKTVSNRRGDPNSLIMSPEETNAVWDFKPKISIYQGIDDIYDYYLTHKEEFKKL